MGLEQADLDKISEMIKTSLETATSELKTAMTTADQGLAASLKNEFKGKLGEIEAKLNDTGNDDSGDDKSGNAKSGDESPAVKALRQQIEALQAENEQAKQKEKDMAVKSLIEQSLSGQNVNPDVKSDLVDKLYAEWKENLTEDNGVNFVKVGTDYKPLSDAAKGFLTSARGAIYLQKPSTDGTNRKSVTTPPTDKNGNGENLDSLLMKGIGEMFGE